MARAITKKFGNAITTCIVRVLGESGLEEKTIKLDGSKSERTSRIQIAKQLKTDNFMLVSVESQKSVGEKTYTLDADTFMALSQYCKDGESYGHDTVTATFKITEATYYTMDSGEPKSYTYCGVTTDRKLRNAVVAFEGTENIIIASTETYDVRMWMSKEDFIANAKIREDA